jgi:hypothetical protein
MGLRQFGDKRRTTAVVDVDVKIVTVELHVHTTHQAVVFAFHGRLAIKLRLQFVQL